MLDAQSEPTVESKMVYQGRIVNLRVDTVRLPSGRLTTREIAEHSASVCMVPLDEDDNVLMVRQFRKPIEGDLLEVPAGGVELGEDPEAAVLRELQEEIGFTAGALRLLAGFWVTPGWSTEYMSAYLATGLSPASLSPDFDENISVERVPLAEVHQMILEGKIKDAKSIAALLLTLNLKN